MSADLILPLVCIGLGLGLLALEVFLPTGGLLGALCVATLGLGLWLGFARSMATGLAMTTGLLLAGPVVLGLAMRAWPHTPAGRWMTLRPPSPEEVTSPPVADGTCLEHLLDRPGRAVTPLRPTGTVEVDGHRIEAWTDEPYLDAGAPIHVHAIRSGRAIVRSGIQSHPTDSHQKERGIPTLQNDLLEDGL